jgi:phosphoglycerate kinase
MSQSATSSIKNIKQLDISGKSVLMRLDFNVPLSDPDSSGHREVTDDNRIKEALPTIKYAIEKGAKVVIGSHLGRPDGERKPEFSLEPVAKHLAKMLGQDVTLADDCVGEGIELMVSKLQRGQVLLLENLRFHAGEEENDPEFTRKLAKLGQVYVNDAFGTAHRKHASTYGVATIIAEKGMGFVIEKELVFMDKLLNNPAKPFYAVLGGAKVSDKIKTIESLLRQVQGIVIGGAMAHAFWAVQGTKIPEGAKQPKPQDIEAAKKILETAKQKDVPVILPTDTNQGFDIGPNTVKKIEQFLANAKTIFWNGPLGWFEKPEYAKGTYEVAKFIGGLKATKVIGGGDTVSAINKSGEAKNYDHLSTGGGAVLEFLELGTLPGIEILKRNARV